MMKRLLLSSLFSLLILCGFAQTNTGTLISADEKAPKFAMPILIVAPDARAAGMGDIGVATLPSINAQNWNASKYIFMEPMAGASFSYVPWLRNIGSSNINLLYLTGYYKFAKNQSIGASFRYFSLGDLSFLDQNANFIQTSNPNEFAVDVSYALQLGEYFSAGVAFRYLRSDLTGGFFDPQSVTLTAANGFAGDIGFYYQSYQGGTVSYTAGFGISNMGTKMSYANNTGDDSYFLPTTMRLGGGLAWQPDQRNKLNFNLELSKYLVPTPPERDSDGNIIAGMDDNVNPITGMIQSFYDAPGGFKEELREIMVGIGTEYSYLGFFNARAGFFYDAKNPNHQYVTIGAGVRYQSLMLDLSYLIPITAGFQNPLANTIHVTLSATINGK